MLNLIENLETVKNTLPSRQKRLCEYILTNCKGVSLMNVGDLAEASGVGRATVMRFIMNLGFDSYGDFKKALHEAYFNELELHNSSAPYFWQDAENISTQNKDSISVCYANSVNLLSEVEQTLDRSQFDRIVDLLISARKVNIFGYRASAPIAHYSFYMLNYLLSNLNDLSDSESLAFDWIMNAGKDEAALMFCSTPVTTSSVRLAKLCGDRQIPLIVISNSDTLADSVAATHRITIPNNPNVKFTVLPYMMIIEALVNEIGNRLAPMSIVRMNEINEYLEKNNIICTQ